jgi:AcrR family transcriptional regulator
MQEQQKPTLDRRSRNRLKNRQMISDVATRLFAEYGFDQVTVGQIAEAADVGRMTVFNHFPQKEDMFFDRKSEPYEMVAAALRDRGEDTSPIETITSIAHQLVEKRDPILPLFKSTRWFVATALGSEALKARARQMRSEFESALAGLLANAVQRPTNDSEAQLVAALTAATWSVAFSEGYDALIRDDDTVEACRTFLSLIDQGMAGVSAAVAQTPYAMISCEMLRR